jgi:hypothetical protein
MHIYLFSKIFKGPKTILFWAPTFNWGFILASILDSKKKPEEISSRLLMSKF